MQNKQIPKAWLFLLLSILLLLAAITALLITHNMQEWQPKTRQVWLRLLENGVESSFGGITFGMSQEEVEAVIGSLEIQDQLIWHKELGLELIFEHDQLRHIGRSAGFMIKLMQNNKKNYLNVLGVQHLLAWQGQEMIVGLGQTERPTIPSAWQAVQNSSNLVENNKRFELTDNRYLIISEDNQGIWQFFNYSDYSHYLAEILQIS